MDEETTKTKLIRIESMIDRFLSFIIGLPAPSTLLFVVIMCGLLIAAGWLLRGLL